MWPLSRGGLDSLESFGGADAVMQVRARLRISKMGLGKEALAVGQETLPIRLQEQEV